MKFGYKFSTQALRRTFFYDYHVNVLKAKMVPFAGYEMPVQYPQGVRERVGVFDVSHMGQVKIYGKDHLKFVELFSTGDIRKRKDGESHLCMILNKNAGIIDDTIVTRRKDHVHLVVNGGNKFIDLDHMNKLKQEYNLDVDIQYLEDKPLLAIQGPQAADLLSQVLDQNLAKLPFMNMVNLSIKGVQYQINRCGYTGEDGYEVAIEKEHAIQFCDTLLKTGLPIFCGLGSRDSLRTEAGLCLHGHEMDENITPIEAKLMWTVRNESEGEELKYNGYDALMEKQKQGVSSKRIGFIADTGIIRPPMDLLDQNGTVVGHVTSGTYSPILKKGIGMGYVKNTFCKLNTVLNLFLRGQNQTIKVVKTPFVPNRYFKQ